MSTDRPVAVDPWAPFDGHEQVVVARDEATGCELVVAIHSTVLGPALGGVRLSGYTTAASPRAAAYADALRLSRAMTYKNALAQLPHGGGKGVIVRDPDLATDDMLRAFGRLVASLDGRYVTAADVGMTVRRMDVVAEECRWTTGRSPERGGVGDSGVLTALGVLRGMQACAATVFGSDDLAGRTVGVVGAGKVGGRLIAHLSQLGARVVAVDPSPSARAYVLHAAPGTQFVASVDDLLARELDVLSPNALGGLLTAELAARLSVPIVCGGANNQLADDAVADLLAARGVLYAPDFMVNCGGVIQVAAELTGGDLDRAREQTEAVYGTTRRVLDRAAREGVTPLAAAFGEAREWIDRARPAR